MKIIHTADWHLGHRLYNYDRTDDEERFFSQLSATVRKERPDALVVCGDIFHSGAPGNDVAKRFTERLLDVQAGCPSMETVVIAGNHDSYSRLVVDKELWRRCRVHVFGMPAEDCEGRADFSGNVVEIPGRGLIAAVPFCHSRNFPLAEGEDGGDRARNYFDGLARYARTRAGGLPTVLMAHLAVGGEIDLRGHDRSFLVGGEERVGVGELGDGYDYIALGHIHCPQWVKGATKLARYSGSPRAIHFDEAYGHGVDVVTVEAGREPEVTTEVFEPLHALVTLCGDEGKPFDEALAEVAASALPPDTFIRVNVRLGAGEEAGPDWTERSRKACRAKGLRFCLNNPVRAAAREGGNTERALTLAELKDLSDDDVIQILSARHELAERHIELIRSLMRKQEQGE